MGVGASAVSALSPLIARDLISGGPTVYGLLLGSFGMGAVGGAIVPRLRFAFPTDGFPVPLLGWPSVCTAGTK